MATETESATSKTTQFMETYGMAAVVSLLSVLALQIVVLAPLVHYGVDLSGLYAWLGNTFGWELEREVSSSPSWAASVVIAYVISRGLKPISLPVALMLTPVVARFMPAKGDGPGSAPGG